TVQPPAKNLWWGPGLTCAVTGAYAVQASMQINRGVGPSGNGGNVVVIVSGVPVLTAQLKDDATGKASATVGGTINLANNQSIAVGYENTTAVAQDIANTTLTVSEVWVP